MYAIYLEFEELFILKCTLVPAKKARLLLWNIAMRCDIISRSSSHSYNLTDIRRGGGAGVFHKKGGELTKGISCKKRGGLHIFGWLSSKDLLSGSSCPKIISNCQQPGYPVRHNSTVMNTKLDNSYLELLILTLNYYCNYIYMH